MSDTKNPKGFFTYFHHAAVIRQRSDTNAGRVYKALLDYGSTGELPDFSDSDACAIVFTMLRTEIDYNFERYQQECENRRIAAERREAKKREKAAQAQLPADHDRPQEAQS